MPFAGANCTLSPTTTQVNPFFWTIFRGGSRNRESRGAAERFPFEMNENGSDVMMLKQISRFRTQDK
jgi:hypothetical protein